MTISRQFLKKFLAYAGGYLLFLLLMGFIFRQDLLTAGFPWLHLPTLSVYVAYLLIYCGCFCLPLYLWRYFKKRRAFNLVRQKKVAAKFQLAIQIIVGVLSVALLVSLIIVLWQGKCNELADTECSSSVVCYNKIYINAGSLSGFINRNCVPYYFKVYILERVAHYLPIISLSAYFILISLVIVYLGIIKIGEYKFLRKKGRLVAGILILLGGLLGLGLAGFFLLIVASRI